MIARTVTRLVVGTCLMTALTAVPLHLALAQQQMQQGTTSGPAVGTPATMGTGGVTAASPHQLQDTRDQGGPAVKPELSQSGGASNKGRQGRPGTESGKTQ